ncbi:MAG: hypothetical protein F4Y26_09375 [Gammaproteobacteria bacterium]|nr:hypothetical protein [Gammaproteobacteria bacterium]
MLHSVLVTPPPSDDPAVHDGGGAPSDATSQGSFVGLRITLLALPSCMTQIARHIAPDGPNSTSPQKRADAYLRSRAPDLGQKGPRRAPASARSTWSNVRESLPEGRRLTVVRSLRPNRREGRGLRTPPVPMVAARQTARNALATRIA